MSKTQTNDLWSLWVKAILVNPVEEMDRNPLECPRRQGPLTGDLTQQVQNEPETDPKLGRSIQPKNIPKIKAARAAKDHPTKFLEFYRRKFWKPSHSKRKSWLKIIFLVIEPSSLTLSRPGAPAFVYLQPGPTPYGHRKGKRLLRSQHLKPRLFVRKSVDRNRWK